jgi:4-amino-4-deoxy-L-arabinose transferase-like glycosyltransferase
VLSKAKQWCSREAAVGALVLLAVAALLIRLDLLIANQFTIDADEAIVGLMALHISEGASWPVFYYGQHYMGSLEPLLVGGLFWLFGPSTHNLVVVPLIFSVLLVPLTYLLARSITGRLGALVAALCMALPPTGLVIWSAKARGGFIEVIFFGALALWLTTRWLRSPRPSHVRTFLIGLTLGIGWWVNNQVVFFMLPIAFCMAGRLWWGCGSMLGSIHGSMSSMSLLVRLQLVLSHGLNGTLAFIFGGLPYWWYNVTHGFPSLAMLTPARTTSVEDHLVGLFSTAIPILLGAKRFWQAEDVFPLATPLAYGIIAISVVTYLVARGRQLIELLVLRPDAERPVELFSLCVVATLAIFSLSSFGWLFEAPRYLLPVYVSAFVLFGALVEHWHKYARWFSSTMLALTLGLSIGSTYLGGRAIPGEPHVYSGERVQKNHEPLITWLTAHNIKWVRTNYWIGYRLAFETREQVRFVTFHEPHHERIPRYREEAEELGIDRMPLVLTPAQSSLVSKGFNLMGIAFHEEEVGGYRVLHTIAPAFPHAELIPRALIEARAGNARMNAELAVDGDVASRWGTGEPQQPGQTLELILTEPQQLGGLAFELGEWPHDYPRGLSIELIDAEGVTHTVLPADGWEAVRYAAERATRYEFRFSPRLVQRVRFIQTGADPIFDWSFAEVFLLSAGNPSESASEPKFL